MRSLLFYVCLVIFLVVGVSAQTSKPEPSSGFSIDNIDKSVDPCVDFYQYACGNWLKTKEIPGDRPEWDSFSEVEEQNLAVLRDILENAEKGGAGRDAIGQKIGDYYGACMDEEKQNYILQVIVSLGLLSLCGCNLVSDAKLRQRFDQQKEGFSTLVKMAEVSIQVSFFTAASIPRAIPHTVAINIARKARIMVPGRASMSISQTGLRV